MGVRAVVVLNNSYVFGRHDREAGEDVGEAEAGLEHDLLLLLARQALRHVLALSRVARLENEGICSRRKTEMEREKR